MSTVQRGAEDELAEIQAALDGSGLYVDPTLAQVLGPRRAEAVRDELADSPTPVYLVVHPLPDDGAYAGEALELLTRLHDRSAQDGIYLAPKFFDVDTGSLILYDRAWGVAEDDASLAEAVAQQRHADADGDVEDVGQYLLDVVTLLSEGTAREAYDAEVAPRFDDPPPAGDGAEESSEDGTATGSTSSAQEDGGGGGTVVAGVSTAVALVLVLALLARWRSRRRAGRRFELPASVVAQVRAAHDARLEDEAQVEVLHLGEAIDRATLRRSDDAGAWQAALDHYDAAQRVLERSRGEDDEARVLDVVGALVLARRGTAALAAAQARRPFVPRATCYLNPLHGTSARSARVRTSGRTVDVALCQDCRADLKAGRDPDVLDVEQRGRPVHYFDSGVEPWSSTGYGTLRPDLLTALHRRR